MTENNSAEARRLVGIAEKFLETRDFNGAKEFAALAQEADPYLEVSEQISTIADVLLSSEKRVNNRQNWYSILQIEAQSNDQELIKRQYRRLALLLHPDKNKYPFSGQAFQLVSDAWAILSDNAKKTLFDNELSLFSRINLPGSSKLPVWKSPGQGQSGNKQSKSVKQEQKQQNSTQSGVKLSSFWTACPYCYVLYEYSRVYENCCLRCRSCERAYEAVSISQLPPLVPEKEAYYCCWGFFPLGFAFGNQNLGENVTPANVSKPAEPPSGSIPSWMPPGFFPTGQQSVNGVPPPVTSTTLASNGGVGRGNATVNVPKKRGRPRKNPLPT